MIDTNTVNTHRVRSRIKNRVENPRQKTVDVRNLVASLVETVEVEIDAGANPIDATWEVLEQEEPYAEMSHTERLYTVGFLFTNYGVSESWLNEDRRVGYAEKWNDITHTVCEYALYEVVHGFATDELQPDPHRIGEFSDSRRDAVRIDFEEDLRTDPIQNVDVHNWIASLATTVSARLANYDNVPNEDRTDVQTALTDAESETEFDAVYDVIENKARPELLEQNDSSSVAGNLILLGSFLDALEDLYDMDGKSCIEGEQLSEAASMGWRDALTTGILWHAMAAAIQVHRETFADDFKHGINR